MNDFINDLNNEEMLICRVPAIIKFMQKSTRETYSGKLGHREYVNSSPEYYSRIPNKCSSAYFFFKFSNIPPSPLLLGPPSPPPPAY